MFYRELGRHMGIPEVPTTYQAFADTLDDYEARHLAHSDAGARLMSATHSLVRARLPAPLQRFAEPLATALLDDPVRHTLGPGCPLWTVWATVGAALGTRRVVVRHLLRPRAESVFRDGIRTPTYPDGHSIPALGPPPAGRIRG